MVFLAYIISNRPQKIKHYFDILCNILKFSISYQVSFGLLHNRLFKLVREKKFRLDLFFRLNTFIVEVPPLVERLEDVAEIAKDWWYTRHKEYLKDESLAALKTYNYPGNVRELVNVLERASLAGQGTDEASVLLWRAAFLRRKRRRRLPGQS